MLVDGVNIMLQVATRFLARASANNKMQQLEVNKKLHSSATF
jgi:hypothetical protein